LCFFDGLADGRLPAFLLWQPRTERKSSFGLRPSHALTSSSRAGGHAANAKHAPSSRPFLAPRIRSHVANRTSSLIVGLPTSTSLFCFSSSRLSSPIRMQHRSRISAKGPPTLVILGQKKLNASFSSAPGQK